jgi:hypothetical protein
MTGDVVLVTTPAMCARRHPWAVVGMWGWQSVLALLASQPLAALAGAAYGGDPRGDAPLWDPGGHALLDWLWHEAHGLSAVVRGAEVALAVAAVVGLVPLAAMLFAMAHATRDRKNVGLVRSVAAGLRAFRPFLVLGVVLGVAGALVAGLGAGAAGLAHMGALASLGEARAEQVALGVALAFLGPVSCVGVVHDLARAAVVRFQLGGLRALVAGTRVFREGPASLWWSWAWRAGVAAALVLVAASVASHLGGRGGAALAVLAVLHQAVVVARVALRASWLGYALRAVDESGSGAR